MSHWLEYLINTMVDVFNSAGEDALRRSDENIPVMPQALRQLDTWARAVLALKGMRCLLL